MNRSGLDPGVAAGPVRLDGTRALAALGEAMARAGYNEETLPGMLGVHRVGDGIDTAYVMRRTAERSSLNLLVRLFLLGEPVEVGHDDLCGLPWRPLVESGVLRQKDGLVGAALKLTPYHGRLIFSDFANRNAEEDYVLGTGGASATLDMLTPRRPIRRALDLGTGSGVQAFMAAGHAEQVIGTDINVRALNLAAAGAAVNGLANIQWRLGSLYEPVAGEPFDLIAANPPFVISPESRFQYRDGGLPGDGISEAVLRGSADHLRPGGLAVVIFNWHHRTDEDWFERPMGWVEAAGCDVWLMAIKSLDALTYAADWLRTSHGTRTEYTAEELDRWVDYYGRQGIARISGGVMILQKRSGPHWRRADNLTGVKCFSNSAAIVDRILASETLLAELDGEAELLACCPRLVAGHRLEQVLHVEDGAWTLRSARVVLDEGISFGGEVDGATIGLLGGCDGKRPLKDLLEELARRLEEPFESMRPVGVRVAMKLMRAGLLEIL